MPMECCLYCGRDTAAVRQICFRCRGLTRPKNASQINDTKDRQQVKIEQDGPVLDDLEYTDFYKVNAPHVDSGRKSTEKFIDRMNKKWKN